MFGFCCACTHAYMCTCVQLALAIVVFSSRHSNAYQRPAFTVISTLLLHGSNHCRSWVSALAQDRNTSD